MKAYMEPQIEVEALAVEDVITTSPELENTTPTRPVA